MLTCSFTTLWSKLGKISTATSKQAFSTRGQALVRDLKAQAKMIRVCLLATNGVARQ